jgi:hypothetical protein
MKGIKYVISQLLVTRQKQIIEPLIKHGFFVIQLFNMRIVVRDTPTSNKIKQKHFHGPQAAVASVRGQVPKVN